MPLPGPKIISGIRNSFHVQSVRKIATVAVAGRINGKIMRQNSVNRLAPSIMADSSNSLGIVFTNPESLAPTNVPLHPTQIYESAGELLIFLLLLLIGTRKTFKGQLFMLYLIFYAVLRFIVEFFRGDSGRGFIMENISVSQGISVLIFVIGLMGVLMLRRRTLIR